MAELKLNDTITFKKIIDTTYFEFNVPKFLVGKNQITVTIKRYSDNEAMGTICYPFVTWCLSTFQETVVPRDSILNNNVLSLKLEPYQRASGCSAAPSIIFGYNSCSLDSALLKFDTGKSQKLLDSKWDSYSFAEVMRTCDSVIIVGHADLNENDALTLSLCRAETIKNYFIQFGVSPARIKVSGIGSDKPRFKKDNLKKLKPKDRIALEKLNARVIIHLW